MGKREKTPRRAWLLPVFAAAVNQTVYYGGGYLARNLPHRDLELPLDRLIPFLPWTVSVYFSCFLFWAITYVYLAWQDNERTSRFYRADFLAKTVCFFCFVFFPTTNQRPAVVGSSVWDILMRFLYQVDQPVNLFPSIHCMVSWLCFLGLRDDSRLSSRYRTGAGLIALAVCLSTLTTRQHVIIDVFGGVLLAETAWRVAGWTKQ